MIVTCPSCSSKYRVRDEAVPAEGAQLQCPTCQSVFVAHPPKHSESDFKDAVERLTAARDQAEQRAADLDGRTAQAESRAATAEARARELEAQLQMLRAEMTSARDDAVKRMRGREEEIARLADETSRMKERLRQLTEVEIRSGKVHEELAQLRSTVAHQGDVHMENARVKEELLLAQRTTARLHQDVDSAQKVVAALQNELQAAHGQAVSPGVVQELEGEVRRLRDQLAAAALSPSSGGDATKNHLLGLIAAVGPMLWGLEQAIKYLEPFASNEPALAGHVRQLQLLCGVLTRLHRESAQA